LLGKGYREGVDIWALGVLIYEMLCGYSPFAADDPDQVTICTRIVKMRISYPPVLTDRVAKNLISKLLVRETTNRIGCMHHGHAEIKDHAWFEGVDWSRLSFKEVTAPWTPTIRSDQDTSNFDECVGVDSAIVPTPPTPPLPPSFLAPLSRPTACLLTHVARSLPLLSRAQLRRGGGVDAVH
jgi:serine/threonine protein kinase